jgi:hypothetical protein
MTVITGWTAVLINPGDFLLAGYLYFFTISDVANTGECGLDEVCLIWNFWLQTGTILWVIAEYSWHPYCFC